MHLKEDLIKLEFVQEIGDDTRIRHCCHKQQNFLLFKGKTSILFFVHLFLHRHLDCFHVLTNINNTTANTGIQIPLQDLDFNFFWIYTIYTLEVEFLDYIVVLFLIFWGNSILFSIVTIPFAFPPTGNNNGSL